MSMRRQRNALGRREKETGRDLHQGHLQNEFGKNFCKDFMEERESCGKEATDQEPQDKHN